MMKLGDTLYSKYIKSRENADILEDEHSFVTYKISNGELIVLNLFVDKEARKNGFCRSLIVQLEDIARENSCKLMTGNIHLIDPGANETMQAALKIGFKLGTANQNTILIYKNISGDLSYG
ncbi:MAG: GNAT family N-acetyltransferase [Bdellovibrionaceae bacterium]|nr:GNAT family N-acetyltransferase [Pseudobdellovibrionaceae bacterium]